MRVSFICEIYPFVFEEKSDHVYTKFIIFFLDVVDHLY